MKERAEFRLRDSYTIYFGGMTEKEARYRDYFETDLEVNPENELAEEFFTKNQISDDKYLELERYDFQEMYTTNPEESGQSALSKQLFYFKYRRSNDSIEDYNRREKRLIHGTLERFGSAEYQAALSRWSNLRDQGKEEQIDEAERQVLTLFAKEGVNQMRDYYQTDAEEVELVLDGLPDTELSQFMDVYTDYARGASSAKGVFSIPKRKWNMGLGFWANMKEEIQDYRGFVAPKVTELKNQLDRFDADVYIREYEALEQAEQPKSLEGVKQE